MKKCICKVPGCGSPNTSFSMNEICEYNILYYGGEKIMDGVYTNKIQEIVVYKDNGKYVYFYEQHFKEFFHTEQEYRKLKLKKINGEKI